MSTSPLHLLKKYDLRPRKSLSQSFLVNTGVARKIVQAAQIDSTDTVVEIGPGLGILTALLAQQARRVIALEVDAKLCEVLQAELVPHFSGLTVIHADAARLDFQSLGLDPQAPSKVVANIPYHITGLLFETLVHHQGLFSRAFLTVQAEVARRVVARPQGKEYGALSVFLQYHTIPKILFHISPGSFSPVPRVGSALIRLEFRQTPMVRVSNEDFFFRLVSCAFSERRKMLRSLLARGYSLTTEELDLLSSDSGIDLTRRGETLELSEFASLAETLWGRSR